MEKLSDEVIRAAELEAGEATGSRQTDSSIEARRPSITAIREIASTPTRDLGATLKVLARRIQHFLPYAKPVVVITLLNMGKRFDIAVVGDLDKDQDGYRDLWQGFTHEVLEHGAPLAIDDLGAYDHVASKNIGWASCLGIPLTAGDERLGAILLYTTRPHRFSFEDLHFFLPFRTQAITAIQRSRVAEEIGAGDPGTHGELLELAGENRLKDHFLTTLSAELRGSLNSVMGYAAMIQDRMLGEINSRQETALAGIMRSCRDQLRLINGILEVVKIEALKERVLEGSRGLTEAADDFERDLVVKALEKTGFNQTKAAKMLGITRRILRYKMDKLKLLPQRSS